MANRDGKNSIQVVHLGNVTLSGTSTVASDWVDTQGYDSVTFVPVVNTVTDAGTASGFSAVIQEGDTSADAGATTATELVGAVADWTVTADGDDDVIKGVVGYVGNSRYARVAFTGTTASAADVSVVAILGNPSRTADADVGTSVAAT